MDSVHASGLGGTFGGNPLSCAAALGAIETMEAENLVVRAQHIGKILGDSLRALQGKYPIIGEVRGRGAMQAIELVEAGTKNPNTAAMNAGITGRAEIMDSVHASGLGGTIKPPSP